MLEQNSSTGAFLKMQVEKCYKSVLRLAPRHSLVIITACASPHNTLRRATGWRRTSSAGAASNNSRLLAPAALLAIHVILRLKRLPLFEVFCQRWRWTPFALTAPGPAPCCLQQRQTTPSCLLLISCPVDLSQVYL
jgi:hypothetical protein